MDKCIYIYHMGVFISMNWTPSYFTIYLYFTFSYYYIVYCICWFALERPWPKKNVIDYVYMYNITSYMYMCVCVSDPLHADGKLSVFLRCQEPRLLMRLSQHIKAGGPQVCFAREEGRRFVTMCGWKLSEDLNLHFHPLLHRLYLLLISGFKPCFFHDPGDRRGGGVWGHLWGGEEKRPSLGLQAPDGSSIPNFSLTWYKWVL